MPFKCIKCDTVRHSEDELDCECENPKFIKCETVHLVDEDGPGALASSKQKSVGVPSEKPQIKTVNLNMCCDKSPRFTVKTTIRSQVTCKSCLEYIAQHPEPEPSDE